MGTGASRQVSIVDASLIQRGKAEYSSVAKLNTSVWQIASAILELADKLYRILVNSRKVINRGVRSFVKGQA